MPDLSAYKPVPRQAPWATSATSFRRPPIPMPLNLLLVCLSTGISALQLIALPAWLLPRSDAWIAVLAASLLLTPFQWALIHEALHGLLLPRSRANLATGRILCVLFGVPFHLLRFGHLAHHRFNRCAADRPEVFDRSRETWLHAALRHYAHLAGGMYLASVVAGLVSLMPSRWLRGIVRAQLDPHEVESVAIARMAEEQLITRYLGAVRIDALGILVIAGASAVLYGPRWPLAGGILLGRALLVSLLDNSYHYGTALQARADAKNFALPAWASGFLLHTNLHRVHHAYPYLPWRALPSAEPALAHPDAAFFTGVFVQLKGPVPVERVS